MSEVLDRIQTQLGAENLSDSCSRDRCRVSMEGVPSPRIVVDLDLALAPQKMEGKRCDFVLFFASTDKDILFAVPMELKSGGVDASEVSAQLQRGADYTHCLAPQQFEAVCLPVLFHGGSIHPKQRKTLNRAKVRFRGRQLTITTARCDRRRNLASVLDGAVQ